MLTPIYKKKGRKRRASYEDEEMTSSETLEMRPPIQTTDVFQPKRNRMAIKKEFPISKLLGSIK